MAHGTNNRQRRRSVTVRLTEEEYQAAESKADAAGHAMGAFTRAALLGAPGPRSRRRLPADRRELLRLLGEINRVGNNINQIARALNAERSYNHIDLELAFKNLDEIRHAILAALGKDQPEP